MIKVAKRLLIDCLLMLMLINTVPAFTAGTVAVLSADDVSLINKTILIPVNISNNPGIMGFKVTASYPSELLEISNVTAGSVTAKGNLIHNAGKVSGQVDVIWYANEQTIGNGSLFILTVKPTESFVEGKSTQITLSFSQADTFNERYEDVAFDCNPINISYGKGSEHTTTYSDPTQETATEAQIRDEQIIDAVDAALDNTASGIIDDVDSDTLTEVNENLRTIVGQNAPQFNSVEELRERYTTAQKNTYSEQAQVNLEPSVISNTLKGILGSRNASSFTELSEPTKSDAVAEAYQKMREADDTLPDLSNILNVNESADMFDSMLKQSTEDNGADNHQTLSHKEFPTYTIAYIVVVISVYVVILILFLRKKQKQKTLKKN